MRERDPLLELVLQRADTLASGLAGEPGLSPEILSALRWYREARQRLAAEDVRSRVRQDDVRKGGVGHNPTVPDAYLEGEPGALRVAAPVCPACGERHPGRCLASIG